MRRPILRIALFLVVVLLVHLGSRYVFMRWIEEQDPELGRETAFVRDTSGPRIVILGDSHSLWGIAPDILKNSANLSAPGEGYLRCYYRLAYIMERHPESVESVILPLELYSFFENYGMWFRDRNHVTRVSPATFLQGPKSYRESFPNYVRYYLFPYSDLTETLETFSRTSVRQKAEELDTIRHRSLVGINAENKARLAEMFLDLAMEDGAWYSQLQMDYLEKIVVLCEEHGVKLYLVRYPTTQYFCDAVSRRMPMNAYEDCIAKFHERHPETPILDYLKSFFGRDECFFDAHHLNYDGMEEFTLCLAHDMGMQVGPRLAGGL
ncbi:MAG TPA: hypothetical protein PKY01_03550 [Candidatus Hydrogenedentes bacterium]|nr:hypothetical protein [Candidatus Hydrogenedentota bacterium]